MGRMTGILEDKQDKFQRGGFRVALHHRRKTMGYYSDVTLILRADAAAKLQKSLADGTAASDASAVEAKRLIDNASHCHRAADGAVLYQWTAVKWYDEFPEVQFIGRFLEGVNGKSYYFIRIGEDYDDIEVSGAYEAEPFGICLERYVSVGAVEGVDATVDAAASAA